MTTPADQQRLIPLEHEVAAHEAALAIHLDRLRVWSRLPDERTDWALEALLQDIETTALALRRLRGDAELPF